VAAVRQKANAPRCLRAATARWRFVYEPRERHGRYSARCSGDDSVTFIIWRNIKMRKKKKQQ